MSGEFIDGDTPTRCRYCSTDTLYVAEAFGFVCPSCGAVSGETDFEIDTYGGPGPHHESDHRHSPPAPLRYENLRKRKAAGQRYATVTEKRARSIRQKYDVYDKKVYEVVTHDTQRHIVGTLNTLGFPSFKQEVERLLFQAHTLGKSGKKGISMHDVLAACFATIKGDMPSVTVDEVCESVGFKNIASVKKALVDLERLLHTSRIGALRNTPLPYIEQHISFLCRQVDGKDTTILGKPERLHLLRAHIGSDHFGSLANTLAQTCIDHGMSSRSGALGQTMDMSLCAFAIVMHAVEAQTQTPCSEGKMAEVAAWSSGWRVGQKMAGFTKAELGFAEHGGSAAEEDERDIDEDELDRARHSTLNTIRETVKRRYAEIARLLSVYVRALPWYEEKGGAKAVRKRPAVVRMGTDVSSIQALPRADLAKLSLDAIKIRGMLDNKVDALLSASEGADSLVVSALPWSRFWSTELQYNNVRQRKHADSPSEFTWTDSASSAEGRSTLDAIVFLESSRTSILGQTLGSTLLAFDSLRQMDGETVDQLLFERDEMGSYLRTPEEVQQLSDLP